MLQYICWKIYCLFHVVHCLDHSVYSKESPSLYVNLSLLAPSNYKLYVFCIWRQNIPTRQLIKEKWSFKSNRQLNKSITKGLCILELEMWASSYRSIWLQQIQLKWSISNTASNLYSDNNYNVFAIYLTG